MPQGRGSVFCIGDSGLFNALYEEGFVMSDHSPDYVVIGETHNYHYDMLRRAVQHVKNGAGLIGTVLSFF